MMKKMCAFDGGKRGSEGKGVSCCYSVNEKSFRERKLFPFFAAAIPSPNKCWSQELEQAGLLIVPPEAWLAPGSLAHR